MLKEIGVGCKNINLVVVEYLIQLQNVFQCRRITTGFLYPGQEFYQMLQWPWSMKLGSAITID